MALLTPEVRSYFNEATNSACYIVKDPSSPTCAIIDPIWNFDLAFGQTYTAHADMLAEEVISNGWQLDWVIETHVPADNLSTAPYLAQRFGAKVAIGSNIDAVQKVLGKVFNTDTDFQMSASRFDRPFKDGERFDIGNMSVQVMHTPGHTPACVTYLMGDAAFIGDTLFMPDFGTARADFHGESAKDLYQSIQKILALPAQTRLFLCHDDKAPGRDAFCCQTTVADQKARNIHVGGQKTEDEFVSFRTTRDAQLSMLKLFIPAVQVNMRAGNLPPAEPAGCVYLKVPIN